MSPEDDREWECAIAADWTRDWDDPREDLYTIEDGDPVTLETIPTVQK